MAQTLEKGHGLLATRADGLQAELDAAVARLSQAVEHGTQEPAAPPGLVNQQNDYLQAPVTGVVARLQMAESKSKVFEAAITDVQCKITSISGAGAGRTVGAADPWQPTFPQVVFPATTADVPQRMNA